MENSEGKEMRIQKGINFYTFISQYKNTDLQVVSFVFKSFRLLIHSDEILGHICNLHFILFSWATDFFFPLQQTGL